jgi:hypothetical protein
MAVCPDCGSEYPDIHMMVYPGEGATGRRCEHHWHRGSDYDPSKLDLTDEDKRFLKLHHIAV